jgi:hypothetical protein
MHGAASSCERCNNERLPRRGAPFAVFEVAFARLFVLNSPRAPCPVSMELFLSE